MSKDIIEHNDDNENQTVHIDGNTPVSMKVVQSIYNEITGKTEKISKTLRENHEIGFDNIKQLNIKIKQLYEQYNVVSQNCSVTVFHMNDCKEQFSSFERFELYDSSNTSPCENIRLQYNFLIVLPGTKQAQPYKIEIDLHSRTALRKKAILEHGVTRRLIRVFASRTGNFDIEYVDYTVARNFMIAMEQWYQSIKKNEDSSFVSFMQDKSIHFSSFFKIITCIILSTALYLKKDILLGDSPTSNDIFSLGLLAFSSIYIAGLIAYKLGGFLEYSIDSIQQVSGLKLNQGDQKAFDESSSANKKGFATAIISFGSIIGLNVFSTYLAKILGIGS